MWVLLCLVVFWLPAYAANTKLFPVHDGELCGYVDSTGKSRIAAKFLDCGTFADGLAPVQLEEGWGYIDETGATAIPPGYVVADSFSEGLAFVTTRAGSRAVIDSKGNVLFPAEYYEHRKFSEGLAAVHQVKGWICPNSNPDAPEDCPEGKGFPRRGGWGYIDRSGKLVIPANLVIVDDFHEGFAFSAPGFIDRQGNQVIAGPYSATTSFSNGIAAVQVDYKTWGYIDKQGGWLRRRMRRLAASATGAVL